MVKEMCDKRNFTPSKRTERKRLRCAVRSNFFSPVPFVSRFLDILFRLVRARTMCWDGSLIFYYFCLPPSVVPPTTTSKRSSSRVEHGEDGQQRCEVLEYGSVNWSIFEEAISLSARNFMLEVRIRKISFMATHDNRFFFSAQKTFRNVLVCGMETSGPLSVRFGCLVSENIIELGNIYALILGRNLIKQFRSSLSLCWLVIEKLWSDRQLCHPDRQNSNKEKRSLIECTGANWFSALSPLEAPFLCATFRASAHLVSYSPVFVGRRRHRKTIVGFRFHTKEAIKPARQSFGTGDWKDFFAYWRRQEQK